MATNDTTSNWNGSEFTVPETGSYLVSGMSRATANNTGLLYIDVSGVDKYISVQNLSASLKIFNGTVQANKGQTISIKSDVGFTALNSPVTHHIHIQKLASPQTILETETVAASYTSNSGQAITDGSIVIYEDISKDTHNAYNIANGVYTIPVSGWYSLNASMEFAYGAYSFVGIKFIKNSVDVYMRYTFVGTSSQTYAGNFAGYFNKGDTVEVGVRTNITSTISATSNANTFSIARIK